MGGEWIKTQIGQRRTFTKLKSFIHFGRWNVHSINPLNPMILTQQSQINLDQGPTIRVKHKQVITIGQQIYLTFIQLKIIK